MNPTQRAEMLMKVRRELDGGAGLETACQRSGVSPSTYLRWAARFDEAGMDGLEDQPRSGRPPCCTLNQEESDFLRRNYLRSNLRDGAGSMTVAARIAAKDETSPLTAETRAAILKVRASKHLIPVEVRRALRASEAEVRRYRDNKSGLNDGLYTPGWLRMASDGSRRLLPGERQVWDDASVNVGVCVPWTRGGDKCSDRWGFRVARFQLLLGIDCATDYCVGWDYVMRANDAYNASDVVHTLWKVWQLDGRAPHECVMEGGAWQSKRALDFLSSSAVQLISAKGRPNQKLVEGWFNRLWTVLSVKLPPGGQVGRFRGEMDAENTAWRRCREGVCDPTEHFPKVTDFMACLDKSINYLNSEAVESRQYGTWIPCEVYSAQAVKGHPLPAGLRRYALPVRATRKLTRQGMVSVSAECPFGWTHPYQFVSEDAYMFDGADVTVSFDPSDITSGAVLELASDFRDMKAGRIIDPSAACISAAPELIRTQSGFWNVDVLDARADARAAKKASRAKIGRQVTVYDERGVKARHAEAETVAGRFVEQYGFQEAAPAIPEEAPRKAVDWASLEEAAGVMVS